MSGGSDARPEIEHIREQSERVLAGTDLRGESALRRQWLAELLRHDLGVVAVQPAEVYEPPAFLNKVLPAPEVAELRDVLRRVRAVNDEHVGDETSELAVHMNGDPEVTEVRAQLRAWCDRYAKRRLERTHPRDGGDPVRTYMRLQDELSGWLDGIAFRQDTRLPRSPAAAACLMGSAQLGAIWTV